MYSCMCHFGMKWNIFLVCYRSNSHKEFYKINKLVYFTLITLIEKNALIYLIICAADINIWIKNMFKIKILSIFIFLTSYHL